MAKKILILASSPRKNGNSNELCDRFALGAQEAGHQVEKISLRDKRIGFCLACDACKRNNGVCAIKDDMAEVLQKMIDADVIVMATPVYFYTMNATMKVLIDRTYARYLEIKGKEFVFILTAADDNIHEMQRTVGEFRGFLDCLSDPIERGIIYGLGAWKPGDIKTSPAMNEAYQMGFGI